MGGSRCGTSRISLVDSGLYCTDKPRSTQIFNYWRRWAKRLPRYNSVDWVRHRNAINEDLFCAHEATRFDPGCRIASFEEALKLAWETEPKECARLSGPTLPFGCHAWPRYDRGFWILYLLDDARAASIEAGSGPTASTAARDPSYACPGPPPLRTVVSP